MSFLFGNENVPSDTKGPTRITETVQGTTAATAANYGVFFIADRDYKVVSAQESHTTLGTDGGAVTLTIEKLTGTQALDAGTAVLSGTFNLKGTINTVQEKIAADANAILKKGDRLALKDSGVLTAVAGVCVTVVLQGI
jgi:hypothetical protein